MSPHELAKQFEEIRDIPYKISLSWEEEVNDDKSCTGKNGALMNFLTKHGYEIRWRVCAFRWSDLPLPAEIHAVPHNDDAAHAYLEIHISNVWRIVDATWDAGLNSILPVAIWDGAGDTDVAVPARETYSPEESTRIMQSDRSGFDVDLEQNRNFYEALNRWFAAARTDAV